MNAGFATDRTFFTPAFRIELEGRDAGRAVVADVLERTFITVGFIAISTICSLISGDCPA